ncbi:Elongation factor P [Serratia symbiotica]|nr:Elongation factor P [Serratia symbiotica]
MTTYSSNNFRPGLKIVFEGEPYAIESSELVKPGKGQGFSRVKMRRLLTGMRVEKTFKSTDFCEVADIIDTNMTYLYRGDDFYHFMHPETFDQYQVEAKIVSNAAKWLQSNSTCIITLWSGRPIAVQPPNFIESEITNTDPGLKGDSASSASKPATLRTGSVIKVPLFIQIGEVVRVDTRTGEYVSRVKQISN